MPKLFIDVGHGGKDCGAVGNNLKEADINLAVGLKLRDILAKQGIEVKMSRTDNSTVELSSRTKMSNSWKSDALISIHCNSASNVSAQGLETFCYKSSLKDMAECVHNEVVKAGLYTKNRGVKEGNFHMVRESNCRACLIELAFISNQQDSLLLKNKQDEFALAIAKGICKYFKVEFKESSSKTETTTQNKVIYRVCVGSYSNKDNALKCAEEAKKKGFPAFVAVYEG